MHFLKSHSVIINKRKVKGYFMQPSRSYTTENEGLPS